MAEAFRKYDFEGDERWQAYYKTLEIPGGRDVSKALERFKAKFYQREVDPSFDPACLRPGTASQPTASATPVHAAETGTGVQGRASQQGPSAEASSRAAKAGPTGIFHKLLRFFDAKSEDRLFLMHSAIIILALVHLQPFNRAWSYRAWLYFLQLSLVAHGYKVYLRYGRPQLWPFSFAAITAWAQPAAASSDFQYAMISLVFLNAKPIILVMVPIVTLAVYHWFAYASKTYKESKVWKQYGARLWVWLQSHQQQALLYNASAEIGAGFLVVIGLLAPPRNFFLIFIYWQFLRMRYWSQDAATYHRAAWTQLNSRFGRYLDYIPIFKTLVGYIQRWFLSAQVATR